jgi:hypothetical protein
VGGRGHRKGQLRALGSPSALSTKEPRTGGPPARGRGSADPFLFCESPLIHASGRLRALKPETGLRAPGASRGRQSVAF